MTIIAQKPHRHLLHLNSSTLQTELGLLMGVGFSVLLSMVIGGVHGKFTGALFVVPAVMLFRWLCEPLVYMINGDDTELTDAGTDLKKEHEVLEHEHQVHYARVEGKRWICICGTSNPYYPEIRIQNCSKCFRSRGFVLKNYGKH